MAAKLSRTVVAVPCRHTNSQRLAEHLVHLVPKDSDYPQSSFMASIDDAAGRHKHKHERYQEISARTMDRSDAMEEELDAMLKQLAAEKTLRCSRKASVGLEGVGEWARVAGNKE